jgi:hypothetical protein
MGLCLEKRWLDWRGGSTNLRVLSFIDVHAALGYLQLLLCPTAPFSPSHTLRQFDGLQGYGKTKTRKMRKETRWEGIASTYPKQGEVD